MWDKNQSNYAKIDLCIYRPPQSMKCCSLSTWKSFPRTVLHSSLALLSHERLKRYRFFLMLATVSRSSESISQQGKQWLVELEEFLMMMMSFFQIPLTPELCMSQLISLIRHQMLSFPWVMIIYDNVNGVVDRFGFNI